jgi:hypothetical protein
MKTQHPLHTRACFALALTLLAAITAFSEDSNRSAAAPHDFTVKLHYGKQIELTPAAVQTIYSNTVELVKSSSFNSGKSGQSPIPWDISEVADDYRAAVSGPYLLVLFKEPRELTTCAGPVKVGEIVVALNENFGRENRSELFTIDDEGRVIAHGKYSGQILLELLKITKNLANDKRAGP